MYENTNDSLTKPQLYKTWRKINKTQTSNFNTSWSMSETMFNDEE